MIAGTIVGGLIAAARGILAGAMFIAGLGASAWAWASCSSARAWPWGKALNENVSRETFSDHKQKNVSRETISDYKLKMFHVKQFLIAN